MKRLKITSVLLSVVMCVTMAFPSICVMADEAAESTETQVEETEKKPETKEPEKKQTTKVPEKKEEPTEPKKEEPTEPKKETPTESEKKQEPTEPKKEEPTEPKKEEPTEPKKEDPTESEKQEPTEPEKEEPTEPEKQDPTEPKKEEPEKQEPTEPEKQAPTETETQAPSETDKQTPEETEPEKEPEATEVPGGKVTKTPKNAAFSNVKLDSATGILTWDAVTGADSYSVAICDSKNVFDVNDIDDSLYGLWDIDGNEERKVDVHEKIRCSIKLEEISKTKDNNYYVYLIAYNVTLDDPVICSFGPITHHYETNAKPVELVWLSGSINKAGTLTWKKCPNAVKYTISSEDHSGFELAQTTATSFDVKNAIDKAIKNREIWKNDCYYIYLRAFDADDVMVGWWEYNYFYKSTAEPKAVPAIQNAHIENDVLSWDSFSGADKYFIRVIADNYDNKFAGFYSSGINIKNVIRDLVDDEYIGEYSHYSIELFALNFANLTSSYGYFDEEDDIDRIPPEYVLAQWTGSYNYKIENTLSVSGKTAKVKKKKVRRKKQTLKVGKVIKFNNRGQGRITYSKISGSKKISINGSNGKVTVKKKTKKGTYKVTVWVKAAGDATHLSAKKKVTFKIKVK